MKKTKKPTVSKRVPLASLSRTRVPVSASDMKQIVKYVRQARKSGRTYSELLHFAAKTLEGSVEIDSRADRGRLARYAYHFRTYGIVKSADTGRYRYVSA